MWCDVRAREEERVRVCDVRVQVYGARKCLLLGSAELPFLTIGFPT